MNVFVPLSVGINSLPLHFRSEGRRAGPERAVPLEVIVSETYVQHRYGPKPDVPGFV
jgi:hypothetical protein